MVDFKDKPRVAKSGKWGVLNFEHTPYVNSSAERSPGVDA